MRKSLVLIIVLVFVSCAPKPSVSDLDPLQVKDLLDKKEQMDLFVLNVHTPYEGKLDKTDAIIEDWQNIAAHVDQLPSNKDTPVLVYCRTGRMSTAAVAQLQELEYTNIYHLNGGMVAWDKAGLPLIDKAFK